MNRAGLALAGLLALSGCEERALVVLESEGLRGLALCETGITAFSQELHPFLRERCASCHSEGGIGPEHSTQNARDSYLVFKEFADFKDIQHSRVMEHVRSRHWLEYDPASVGAEPDEMESRLMAWWEQGESQCPQQGLVVTESQEIPADLPAAASGEYRTLRWNLREIGPAFEGSSVEIGIQRFREPGDGNPGSYRVAKPRLIAPEATLAVRGMWLSVNDRINAFENSFSFVNQVVAARPVTEPGLSFPFPLLSTQKMVVLQRPEAPNRLAIAFERLAFAEPRRCLDLSRFEAQVLGAVQGRCLECHAQAGHAAFKRFPLEADATPAESCARMLERADLALPESSSILVYPLDAGEGHPPVFAAGEAPKLKRRWLEWLYSEKSLFRISPRRPRPGSDGEAGKSARPGKSP